MTWLILVIMFGGLSLLAFSGRISRKGIKFFTYIALILFALLYEPSELADMYRFREALVYMKTYGADAAYTQLWYIYENSEVFFDIMVVLSYIPVEFFFPIALLCTYGIGLVIFFDMTDSLELTKHQFALLYSFFLCCVNFGVVFSIMRFFMAYLIGFAGIYMWFKNGATAKRRILAVIMIFSATFIHTAGFLVPAIWLMTILCYVKPVKVLSILIPFSLLFVDQIIKFTGGIFGNASLYETIVEKFFTYSADNYEDMYSRSRVFYYQLLAFIAIVFLATKILKHENVNYVAFNNVYMLMLLFTIAFIPNVTLFVRIFQILIILTPAYFAANKGFLQQSRSIQLCMVAECIAMLMFYGRLSTYYYL